jgi:DeoR family suf operon transcriptional repressor
MPAGALEALTPVNRALLLCLKRAGRATADEMAKASFLSRSTASRHLVTLEALGLVEHTGDHSGPGRPVHVYKLTAAGETLFPSRHGALTNLLFDALDHESPDVRARVIERTGELATEATRAELGPLKGRERIDAYVTVAEARGFMPEVEELGPGRARLTFRHCPVSEVAREHTEICEIESRGMGTILDAHCARSEWRGEGGASCAYDISFTADGRIQATC